MLARFAGRVSIDLGTGDGRAPLVWARESPERLFIGVDANAAGLCELSGRAFRTRLANVVYVRASVEDLPPELRGVADQVTVVLPWGSLLAAVARPSIGVLRNIQALCRPDGTFRAILGCEATCDQAEIRRLGLRALLESDPMSCLVQGYADAGFALRSVKRIDAPTLASWPSTWAKRLGHGRPRTLWELEAKAAANQT